MQRVPGEDRAGLCGRSFGSREMRVEDKVGTAGVGLGKEQRFTSLL